MSLRELLASAADEMNVPPPLGPPPNPCEPVPRVDNISAERAPSYYPNDPLFEARRDLFPLPQGEIEYGTPGWGRFSSAASVLNLHKMSETLLTLRSALGTFEFLVKDPATTPHDLRPLLLVVLDLASVYHAKAAKAAQQGWCVPDTTAYYAMMGTTLDRITSPPLFDPLYGDIPRYGPRLAKLALSRAEKEFGIASVLRHQELSLRNESRRNRGEPAVPRAVTPRTFPYTFHHPH